ncbi:12355_t:CDS:10 [Gigaspora rosea]|nr:12355_t:CDS:10 [Gigaspora rosea]
MIFLFFFVKHDVKRANTEWKQARDKCVLYDMTNLPTAGRKRKNHDTNAMDIPSKRMKKALSNIPLIPKYSSFACSSSSMTLGNGKLPEKVHLWEDFLEKIDEYIFDKEQIIFQKPQFNYNRLLFNESNETSHRKGSMSSTKWVNKRCQNSTKQAKKPRTNVWLYALYSLGVLTSMWEISNGYPPFEQIPETNQFISILTGSREIPVEGTLPQYTTLNTRHLEAFVHELKHLNIFKFNGIIRGIEETYAAICKKKQQNGLYKISWAELIKIAKEIHDRYIIHQNLYSKNILMDNGCALIVDFLLLYQKIFPATSSNEKEARITLFFHLPLLTTYISISSNKREKIIDDTPSDYAILYQKCWSLNPAMRPPLNLVFCKLEMLSGLTVELITNNIYKDKSNNVINSESESSDPGASLEWSLDHYYSWVHENYNVTEEANAHKFFYGIVYSINNDFVALEEVQTFTEKLLRRQKHDVKRANTGWKQARDKRVLCDMTNLPTAGRKRKNHDTNAMDIPSKRMKVLANTVRFESEDLSSRKCIDLIYYFVMTMK